MHFLMLFIFLSVSVMGDYVTWYADYNRALEVASYEEKPLMVLLIKKDSKLCKKTIREAFSNQPYIKKINNEFISVVIVKNQKSSYPLELLYTLKYPTLFFLDNQELFLVNPIVEKITPKILKEFLE